tara:strand:+ start:13702 stop:14169 length:468 start_codon:yes stop_codon:yes gene_type:complete
MRKVILTLTTVLVLGTVNFMIAGKERTLRSGQPVLLKLAPVDPRSLMQGDYMILRYELERDARFESLGPEGVIVLGLDANQVGSFARSGDREPLGENECFLQFKHRRGIRIGANAFFFEEGSAGRYDRTEYGELRVDANGKSVLVGLRDEDFKPL